MTAIEQEVTFYAGPRTISGTLRLPGSQGTYPGVLLIPGSGQVDRNENARKLAINAFHDIAYALAEAGIASLRYDKRGVGSSQGNFWETGFYDNVSDAARAFHFLKFHERIQPENAFLLGHSEGALIATRLAATGADAAGAILLSGSARPGREVLLWQAGQVVKGMHGLNGFLINALHIDVQKAERKQMDKVVRSRKDWYRLGLVGRINARWMREFMAYDPAEDLPKIHIPVLAITGSKDVQVNPADLERMARLVKTGFEQHEMPDLTHILRAEPGEAGLSTYRKQVQRPVDGKVLDFILDWLQRCIVDKPVHAAAVLPGVTM